MADSPGHIIYSVENKACSTCGLPAEGAFVNVDFVVLGHPENSTRRAPAVWWSEYCNKFFYFSLLLVCFHLNFLL